MKRKKWYLILAAILAAAGLTATAQTSTNPPAEVVVGGVTYYAQPPVASTIPTTSGFTATVKALGNDLASASNYSVNVYGTYKPSVPNGGSKVGAGGLLIYNVSGHVGVAAGLDYLGSWTLVSGNVTFKLPMQPLKGYGFTNLWVTPNMIAGIGTSFGGSGSSSATVETIAGTGASLTFGHWLGGSFDTGFEAVNLSNAGAYSGWDYRLFIGWGKGF